MASRSILFLLVGLPGSGKTTRAREIEGAHHALRLSPDEWMIPLFGESDAGGKRDILEARLIWVALRAIQSGISAVLDFGFWTRDERSALVWLAESVGAHASVVYLAVDEPTQFARTKARFMSAPDTTFAMSAEELAGWRAFFQVPTDDELAGTFHPHPPVGWETWSDWASARWPSLPPLNDIRLQQPAG
ncbi:MAG TPA: ATP-binding protein [Chloroflexota bacterium]|nr:ATP-binding protein [Chloroflexota bacterium]